MPELAVRTPDDAWEILADIAANRLDPDKSYDLDINGWALELLRLPNVETSSISMPAMRSLLAYQTHINKSFKILKYDRAYGRLPRNEREEIEFNIVVAPNGSRYNADVKRAIVAFVNAAAQKMESRHLTLTMIAAILILATGYFGLEAFKAHVAAEAASRDLTTRTDQQVKLSEQETARAKILGTLAANSEAARMALVQVESSFQPLLRTAAANPGTKILGVEIPQEIAQELAKNPRHTGEGARLDGLFEVIDIKRHEIGVFSAVVKSAGATETVTTDVRSMFLPDDQIDLLLSSLRSGRSLNIMMNTWKRDGKVVSAEIVRVNQE